MRIFLATLLLFVGLGSQAQVRVFSSLTNLIATDPRAFMTGDRLDVAVSGYYTQEDWGSQRGFTITTDPAGLSTNRGNVFRNTARPEFYHIADDRLSPEQDPRWFGARTGGTNSAIDGIQATIDFCTNSIVVAGGYVSMPGVKVSSGIFKIDRPLNLTMPFGTNTLRTANAAFTFEGAGPYATQFKIAFTNAADMEFPAFDGTGWANCKARGFTIDSPNEAIYPKAGFLLARRGYGEVSGYCRFSDVHIVGTYGLMALVMVASEINTFEDCRFNQYVSHDQYSVLGIGYHINGRIQSKFVTLGDPLGSGNGANKFISCQFHANPSDEFGQGSLGRNAFPRVRLEFSQSTIFDGCYWVTPTNGSPAIEIALRTEGPIIRGARHEFLYAPNTPFISIVSQSITNPVVVEGGETNFYPLGEGPVVNLSVTGSAVGGIVATNQSQIFGMEFANNRYYGGRVPDFTNSYPNRIGLTNVFPAMDVYDLVGSRISTAATSTNFAEPYLLSFTVRNESKDNVWTLPTNSILSRYKGAENDYDLGSVHDRSPRYLAAEFGGLEFLNSATANESHASATLLASSRPRAGNYTVQAIVTAPVATIDGSTHGIVSLAPTTNSTLIGTNAFVIATEQDDLQFRGYGTTLTNESRWSVRGAVSLYAGRRVVITMVRDAGTNGLRVYLDGIRQPITNTVSGAGADWAQDFLGAQNLNIGGIQENAVANCFRGIFHRATIWTNSFTDAEVGNLVRYGIRPNAVEPVLDLDFSGYPGATNLVDLTGRGQRATIYGNPVWRAHYAAADYLSPALTNYVLRIGDTITPGPLIIANTNPTASLILDRAVGTNSSSSRFSQSGSKLTIDASPNGAVQIQNTNAIGMNKIAAIDGGTFNGARPVRMLQSTASSAANDLDLGGGGSSGLDAMTRLRIWIAGAVGVDAGTQVASWTLGGLDLLSGFFKTTATTNTMTHVAGFNSSPASASKQLHSISIPDLANTLSPFIPPGAGGGITDAPNDGKYYGRRNLGWSDLGLVYAPIGGGGGGIAEAPNDAIPYMRQSLGWTNGHTVIAADLLVGPLIGSPAMTMLPDDSGIFTTDFDNFDFAVFYKALGDVTSGPSPMEIVNGASLHNYLDDHYQSFDPDLYDLANIGGIDGDILIRSGGHWDRLPKATDGNVLTLASGLPAWGAGGGGGISDAPSDGNPYGRQSAAWTNLNGRFVIRTGDRISGNLGLVGTSGTLLQLERPGFTNFTSLSGGITTMLTPQGALALQSTMADATAKQLRIQAPGYLIAGRPTAPFFYASDAANNYASIGTALTSYDAINDFTIYTGAAGTNVSAPVFRATPSSVDVLTNSLRMLAPTGVLTHVGGFDSDPTGTTIRQVKVATLANLANQLAPLLPAGGGGSGAPLNGTNTWTGTNTFTLPTYAPTPPARDESTKVATTAFLGGMAGSLSGFRRWDELLNPSALIGDSGSAGLANSGTVFFNTVPEAGRPGLRTLRCTASNQTPLFGWYSASAAPTFRGPAAGSVDQFYFESAVKTPAFLSGQGGTNEYAIRVGFNSVSSATNTPLDGVWLIYQTNILAGGTQTWAFQTISNATTVTLDTGVSVAASTWYKLAVYMDATNVVGYINGTQVATTNIASIAVPLTRGLNAMDQFARFGGGGATILDTGIDYLVFDWKGAAR